MAATWRKVADVRRGRALGPCIVAGPRVYVGSIDSEPQKASVVRLDEGKHDIVAGSATVTRPRGRAKRSSSPARGSSGRPSARARSTATTP